MYHTVKECFFEAQHCAVCLLTYQIKNSLVPQGVANGGSHRLGVPYLPTGVKKKTSFSGVHARLNKQLSDVAEIVQKEG